MPACRTLAAALMAPSIPGADQYLTQKPGVPFSQAVLDKVQGWCGVRGLARCAEFAQAVKFVLWGRRRVVSWR